MKLKKLIISNKLIIYTIYLEFNSIFTKYYLSILLDFLREKLKKKTIKSFKIQYDFTYY